MQAKRPGRPPKSPADRRDDDLRIPLTSAEKALIRAAAAPADMAQWARSILVGAAKTPQAGRKKNG